MFKHHLRLFKIVADDSTTVLLLPVYNVFAFDALTATVPYSLKIDHETRHLRHILHWPGPTLVRLLPVLTVRPNLQISAYTARKAMHIQARDSAN